MNREGFLETLKQQYAEDIHAAWIECEKEYGEVNYPKLNQLLSKLMKNAKLDGLSQKDFEELVRSTIPEASKELALSVPKAA